MRSDDIRKKFLDYFASKQHKIVPSAPLVNKGDPTLMFTNAGMNQFKDFFLGNQVPEYRRIADTQKCLRVSGKHNDLEDVGLDGTHHTMFEMLGNWSIGDYFKKEAIEWSWELLTKEYGMDPGRLYATVFEGDQKDNLPADEEALALWGRFLPVDHILYGNKKDNFWEMGDTGPCGPCSEIHYDMRSAEERAQKPGGQLVNVDGSGVVEIWNNVFIQFNRKADGSLEQLPEKHVDTGMGFERLCMVLQEKTATYDTDVFTPFIELIEKQSGFKYGYSYDRQAKSDIAMRVVSDHIRAIAFAIADGQLPDNNGAGYVIRRILRRAVRYYYSFLGIKRPFLFTLLPLLAEKFTTVFPELKGQLSLVSKIVEAEETTFLNTLETGLRRIENLELENGTIKGIDAFELYDTYGFPIDLTSLIAQERGWLVDKPGFDVALQAQKDRSRADAQRMVGDWIIVNPSEEVEFVGYDYLEVENAKVIKYRTVNVKGADQFHLVLNKTPFYGESGGQSGDTGWIHFDGETIKVLDTQKENDLIVHIVERLPENILSMVVAQVEEKRRRRIENNHTAVHLMHAALHRVLGEHALQKGQDVDDERLRFDFSHFQKVSAEELLAIEEMVNAKIRQNILLLEDRNMPIEQARKAGAMMLFGEKYGDLVRMVTFDKDFSQELCGGTHVPSTGHIGLFKIVSEGAVAAGIRRLEAVTAEKAEKFVGEELAELNGIRALLPNPKNAGKQVSALVEESKALKKKIEGLVNSQALSLKKDLLTQAENLGDATFLSALVEIDDSNALKNLAMQLEKDLQPAVIAMGAMVHGKPQLLVAISKELNQKSGLHAGNFVKEMAALIGGGGGGQPFFATAGGVHGDGLNKALQLARELVIEGVKAVS